MSVPFLATQNTQTFVHTRVDGSFYNNPPEPGRNHQDTSGLSVGGKFVDGNDNFSDNNAYNVSPFPSTEPTITTVNGDLYNRQRNRDFTNVKANGNFYNDVTVVPLLARPSLAGTPVSGPPLVRPRERISNLIFRQIFLGHSFFQTQVIDEISQMWL